MEEFSQLLTRMCGLGMELVGVAHRDPSQPSANVWPVFRCPQSSCGQISGQRDPEDLIAWAQAHQQSCHQQAAKSGDLAP